MPHANSERLRQLAAEIRRKTNAREAIADGFELIATAMEPCIDCQAQPLNDLGELRTVDALEKIESAWAEADGRAE